jgi:hypothetical protein
MLPNILLAHRSTIYRLTFLGILVLSMLALPLPPQVKAQPTGMLISEGKSVTASSSDPAYPPQQANDGNTSTMWLANSTSLPQWWQVDLGEVYNITHLQYSLYHPSHPCAYPMTILISVSNDGLNWSPNSLWFGTGSERSDAVTSMGRYVRVEFQIDHMSCPGSPYKPGIKELALYGTPQSSFLTLTDSAQQPITALALEDGWPTRNADSGVLANPIRATVSLPNQPPVSSEQDYTLVLRIFSADNKARFYAYNVPPVAQGCETTVSTLYGNGGNSSSFTLDETTCTVTITPNSAIQITADIGGWSR